MLAGSLGALAVVLLARAAAGYGGEVTALRAAAAVKSQLRRKRCRHVVDSARMARPGTQPRRADHAGRPRASTRSTRTSRATCRSWCSPRSCRSPCWPGSPADGLRASTIAVTLPLIPVFMAS